MSPPPESLTCGPARLRRWRPEDLEASLAAVRASRDHLRPWMPWAQEEPTERSQASWLAIAVHQWDAGESFGYALLPAGSDTVVGSAALENRIGPGGLEIGYWLHPGHLGRGLATAAAAGLSWAGLQVCGADRVEIRCDRANTASAAIPARLGYALTGTRPVPVQAPAQTGEQQVWVLSARSWSGSGARRLWTEHGDAAVAQR